MTPTHLHLILTHVPILGVLFGTLLLGWALLRRSDELQRLALVLFVLAGLMIVPVYQTGEPAEETVEHLPGVAEAAIERHEEAAETSLVVTEILAFASLGVLIFRRRAGALGTGLVVGVLLLAVAASASLAWTGSLGGQIRHTEIASGGAGAPAPAAVEHDDD